MGILFVLVYKEEILYIHYYNEETAFIFAEVFTDD